MSLLQEAAGNTPVFAFIDEYDSPFNNLVLRTALAPKDKEKALDALNINYNSFIKALKDDKIRNYMTGVMNIRVSGVTMDQVTFDPRYHALSGYTEDDVRNLLHQIRALLPQEDSRPRLFEEDKIFPLLKDAYNGYWFVIRDRGQCKMYNADMVNYFVRFTLRQYSYPTGAMRMSEFTTLSDNILTFAASLPYHSGLLVEPLVGNVIPGPLSALTAADIMKLYTIPADPSDTRATFWQILYSFGALTTKQVGITDEDIITGVPNAVTKDEYLTIAKMIRPDVKDYQATRYAFHHLVQNADPKDFLGCFFDGRIQVDKFERGGGFDINNPEPAFKALLLAGLFYCVSSERSAEILNELCLDKPHQTFGNFVNVTVIPNEQHLKATIIELKNVSLKNLLSDGQLLLPRSEDFNEQIARGEEFLRDLTEEQLLSLKYVSFEGDHCTIQSLVNGGLKQAEEYCELEEKGWWLQGLGLCPDWPHQTRAR